MAKGKKTGGRVAGIPNRATREIKEAARMYGPAAVERLAELAGLKLDRDGNRVGMAQSEKAQVSALNAVLDRGYGKPTQPLASDPEQPLILQQIMGTLEGINRGLPSKPG